jgi:hypothetical protein
MIDNVFIRCYLFATSVCRRLLGNRDQRAIASNVLSMLFRSPQ